MKRFISLVLIMIMLSVFAVTTSATTTPVPTIPATDHEDTNLCISDEHRALEQARMNGEADSPSPDDEINWLKILGKEDSFQTFGSCIPCGVIVPTVCAGDFKYDGSYVHYPLTSGPCNVRYYQSRGASICRYCYTVIEQYNYHDCWEIHDTCWKSSYDVCPMEIS